MRHIHKRRYFHGVGGWWGGYGLPGYRDDDDRDNDAPSTLGPQFDGADSGGDGGGDGGGE